MAKKKAMVLFSGGLDSRLTAVIMKELGFEVELCFVKLPFGGGCCNNLPCIFNFSQTLGFKLNIVDGTKGKNFKEYVEIIRNPRYGIGAGMNPCKDCKIFIFKQGKKIADKIKSDVIVTGEVLSQRPMSQMKKALLFDDEKAGLTGKILRPLSAKLLPETDYEKEGLINRKKLLDIHGRRREKQMNLAKKYKIKYPTPAGGCLLCEKNYSKRLNFLFDYKKENQIKYEEIALLNKSKMFFKEGLIYAGRNKEENTFIERVNEELGWNIFFNPKIPGPTVIYEKTSDKKIAKKIWDAYSEKDKNKIEKLREILI